MDRLIEADEYFEVIRDDLEIRGESFRRAVDHLHEMKTVDAVEVVRCKDCNYYKKVKGAVGGWCDCELTPFDMDPDDFCSRGERRSE